MKSRLIFKSHYLVPYALICGYGLFSVTAPPRPTDAETNTNPPAAVQLPDPPSRKLAEQFHQADPPSEAKPDAR